MPTPLTLSLLVPSAGPDLVERLELLLGGLERAGKQQLRLQWATPLPSDLPSLRFAASWCYALGVQRWDESWFAGLLTESPSDPALAWLAHWVGLLLPREQRNGWGEALAARLREELSRLHPEAAAGSGWRSLLLGALLHLAGEPTYREIPENELLPHLLAALERYPAHHFPAPTLDTAFSEDRSLALVAANFLLELELRLLEAGYKAIVKYEALDEVHAREITSSCLARGWQASCYTSDETTQTERYLSGNAAAPGSGNTWNVLIARTADDSAAFEQLHRAEQQGSREAGERIGQLLGYPRCCVEAFSKLRLRNDLTALARAAAHTHSVQSLALVPGLPWSAVDYFPCRLDCPESLPRTGFAAHEPPVGPMLLAFPFGCLSFPDAVPIGECTLRYREVTASYDHPWVQHLRELFLRGDRVQILAQAVLIWGGEHLVEAFLHDRLLPLNPGGPNLWPWLGSHLFVTGEDYHHRTSAELGRDRLDEDDWSALRWAAEQVGSWREALPEGSPWRRLRLRMTGRVLMLTVPELPGLPQCQLSLAREGERSYCRLGRYGFSYQGGGGASVEAALLTALAEAVRQPLDEGRP